jgi:hypothetical protein
MVLVEALGILLVVILVLIIMEYLELAELEVLISQDYMVEKITGSMEVLVQMVVTPLPIMIKLEMVNDIGEAAEVVALLTQVAVTLLAALMDELR